MKSATVRADVAIKVADFFGDLGSAVKGPFAFPGEMLARTHSLNFSYTFDVKDWTPGLILEFQSWIVSLNRSAPVTSQASAIVRLEAQGDSEGDGLSYSGQGTLSYQTGPPPNRKPCSTLITGSGTTRFDVVRATIRYSDAQTSGSSQQARSTDVELYYRIYPTNEIEQEFTDPSPDTQCKRYYRFPSSFWFAMHQLGRGENGNRDEVLYGVKDWVYVGQREVLATKTLTSTCMGQCDQEVSIFTLKEAVNFDSTVAP